MKGICGRIEIIPTHRDFTVITDYAHTPDGLENVLHTARELVSGRLITVFGCGGDRDHGKRPQMGELAGRLSDYAIITSDNPRTEDPLAIIAEQILQNPGNQAGLPAQAGFFHRRSQQVRVPDFRTALRI